MVDCDNDQECEKIVPGEITPKPLPPSGGGGTSDFNDLDNRPMYDGEMMTGETNIPDLTTPVSQLGEDVEDIKGVIPEAATTSNQLADKNFVNSSVATNTANFVGTFNSVAELEAVQNPSNNDYGFVISTDSAGNTVYNRYKYNASTATWAFEYALNNSSFTSDQWAAINSAITSNDVTKIRAIAEIDSVGTGLELDSNNELSAKLYTSTGNNEDGGMTQKAITAALAGVGGAIELTSADYNYPTDNPTGVALWLLPAGVYYAKTGVSVAETSLMSNADGGFYTVSDLSSTAKQITATRLTSYDNTTYTKNSVVSTSGQRLRGLYIYNPYNGLDSTAGIYPLAANQGKVLNSKIEGRIIQNAGAPTTATVGTVGKLLEDTTNGKLYICTAVSGSTYTWEEVGGGGGNVGEAKILTTADYNYPTDNPTGVALWLLEPGMYCWDNPTVTVYSHVQANNTPYSVYVGTAFVYNPRTNSSRAIRVRVMHGDGLSGSGLENSYYSDKDMILWKETGKSAVGHVSSEYEYQSLNSRTIADNLDTTSTGVPLSANCGRVIKNLLIPLPIDQTTFNTLWEEA